MSQSGSQKIKEKDSDGSKKLEKEELTSSHMSSEGEKKLEKAKGSATFHANPDGTKKLEKKEAATSQTTPKKVEKEEAATSHTTPKKVEKEEAATSHTTPGGAKKRKQKAADGAKSLKADTVTPDGAKKLEKEKAATSQVSFDGGKKLETKEAATLSTTPGGAKKRKKKAADGSKTLEEDTVTTEGAKKLEKEKAATSQVSFDGGKKHETEKAAKKKPGDAKQRLEKCTVTPGTCDDGSKSKKSGKPSKSSPSISSSSTLHDIPSLVSEEVTPSIPSSSGSQIVPDAGQGKVYDASTSGSSVTDTADVESSSESIRGYIAGASIYPSDSVSSVDLSASSMSKSLEYTLLSTSGSDSGGSDVTKGIGAIIIESVATTESESAPSISSDPTDMAEVSLCSVIGVGALDPPSLSHDVDTPSSSHEVDPLSIESLALTSSESIYMSKILVEDTVTPDGAKKLGKKEAETSQTSPGGAKKLETEEAATSPATPGGAKKRKKKAAYGSKILEEDTVITDGPKKLQIEKATTSQTSFDGTKNLETEEAGTSRTIKKKPADTNKRLGEYTKTPDDESKSKKSGKPPKSSPSISSSSTLYGIPNLVYEEVIPSLPSSPGSQIATDSEHDKLYDPSTTGSSSNITSGSGVATGIGLKHVDSLAKFNAPSISSDDTAAVAVSSCSEKGPDTFDPPSLTPDSKALSSFSALSIAAAESVYISSYALATVGISSSITTIGNDHDCVSATSTSRGVPSLPYDNEPQVIPAAESVYISSYAPATVGISSSITTIGNDHDCVSATSTSRGVPSLPYDNEPQVIPPMENVDAAGAEVVSSSRTFSEVVLSSRTVPEVAPSSRTVPEVAPSSSAVAGESLSPSTPRRSQRKKKPK